VEAAVRLIDLGVEPWIVANALTAILAQRLVRLACKNCQELVALESPVLDGEEIVLERGTKVVRPKGCSQCMKTGYKGRTGIFEVVIVDDDMRELVKHKASPREYRALLKRRGIPTLRRIGLGHVKDGRTTVDEVVRVTT
jgi:general secretion pathway protein E/type IV pilus assembly protein PilB